MIIWFWVQFGINLYKWIFQKAEIARAASVFAISAFWKTHKCKLIPNWTRKTAWLLINNINLIKFAWRKCWKIFLEATFSHLRKLYSKFPHKIFIILCDIIGLENFLLSFSQSNSELCCVICTSSVTLFAPVLHFLHWCYTWTALLSANQKRVIFSCILLKT